MNKYTTKQKALFAAFCARHEMTFNTMGEYYSALDTYFIDWYNNIMKTIQAFTRNATAEYPKYVVIVREFKFDNIRQESYWMTKEVREYRLRVDAEKFAARFA